MKEGFILNNRPKKTENTPGWHHTPSFQTLGLLKVFLFLKRNSVPYFFFQKSGHFTQPAVAVLRNPSKRAKPRCLGPGEFTARTQGWKWNFSHLPQRGFRGRYWRFDWNLVHDGFLTGTRLNPLKLSRWFCSKPVCRDDEAPAIYASEVSFTVLPNIAFLKYTSLNKLKPAVFNEKFNQKSTIYLPK